MSEELKIALTAFGGVGVFVIGQIIQRLFIEPIQDQRKLIGEIVHALTFHSNLFAYNKHFMDVTGMLFKASEIDYKNKELVKEQHSMTLVQLNEGTMKLRDLSSRIHQSIRVIPWYPVIEYCRIVPERDALCDVASSLMKWATDPEPSRENTVRYQWEIIEALSVRHFIRETERRRIIASIEQR